MTETEEELKNLLMRVKEETEKASLKLNIKKKLRSWHRLHHFTANKGGRGGSSDRAPVLGLGIAADGTAATEPDRLLLGRKATAHRGSGLKSKTLCRQRSTQSRLWSSQWSRTVVRAGQQRRQDAKDPMPSNCGAGEDSWESLEEQGDHTRQS